MLYAHTIAGFAVWVRDLPVNWPLHLAPMTAGLTIPNAALAAGCGMVAGTAVWARMRRRWTLPRATAVLVAALALICVIDAVLVVLFGWLVVAVVAVVAVASVAVVVKVVSGAR